MAEENSTTKDPSGKSKLSKSREANWPAVLLLIHIHLLSLYGLWLLFFEVKWKTVFFLLFLTSIAILGMTSGAHRLWAHQTYKATKSLRLVLMLCQTMAGIGSIYDWVQYHKLHHQVFATEDDPYDHNKGFLYGHIITRTRKLSPYQEKLKESIDMSDVETDSIVMFQKTFYWVLYGVLFILLPLNAPLEYWDDTVLSATFVIGFLRYGIILHASWLIESSISVWGLKSGEKSPPDSNSVFVLNKSFWPHYHYLVPYDYKSGEYGTYDSGCSTAFIRVWAALGLATDLKTVETLSIQKALAKVVKTKQPIETCLEQAVEEQDLSEDHYLQRGLRLT
ncbi:acyl-CoA Delta-9 desaturase [Achroia grisella]|uniref:acyl-CoA Delta-9 desaturase n=1 Tax=Achroia grisella TaxID=688607 RepID=UPI0027D29F52|nr:acyl-CoA Delta-9 desaturase [Achroia grisella]XP_059050060.1 acyl-CoA Delta-9 desaturase [Achroia grisella]